MWVFYFLSALFGPYQPFHQGEDFILRFKIRNESRVDLHFTHGYPTMSFFILNEDTIIASSDDYTAYVLPIERGTIKKINTI
jgi:hypothetical protein